MRRSIGYTPLNLSWQLPWEKVYELCLKKFRLKKGKQRDKRPTLYLFLRHFTVISGLAGIVQTVKYDLSKLPFSEERRFLRMKTKFLHWCRALMNLHNKELVAAKVLSLIAVIVALTFARPLTVDAKPKCDGTNPSSAQKPRQLRRVDDGSLGSFSSISGIPIIPPMGINLRERG